jgi:Peptide-N-glycosidase F, C terminal/Peptide-N-glycosidase F, N terminal
MTVAARSLDLVLLATIWVARRHGRSVCPAEFPLSLLWRRPMPALRPSLLPIGFALLTACSGKDGGDDTNAPTRTPGEDQTVVVFDGEYVHYGTENRRSVDVTVTFPDATTTYSGINGRFALRCPNDACDWWDRYGNFGLVTDAGLETEQFIELDRFITPYQVGMEWEADLTPLRPLLTGEVTLRVFIDTWVTEGHEQGDGWLFDASLDFQGGDPPVPEAVEVLPVWGHLSWLAGQPENPVEAQVVPTTLTLPAASAYTLRSFITGHGWNNSQNCAEFCAQEHYYTVAGVETGREVWRDDCEDTVTDGTQQGTWRYSRAGWCPGAQVYPWDIDVTDAVAGAETADVSYRLNDWEWEGDGDTPYYYMSGVVIAYQ